MLACGLAKGWLGEPVLIKCTKTKLVPCFDKKIAAGTKANESLLEREQVEQNPEVEREGDREDGNVGAAFTQVSGK